jgi:hypothetical protein
MSILSAGCKTICIFMEQRIWRYQISSKLFFSDRKKIKTLKVATVAAEDSNLQLSSVN